MDEKMKLLVDEATLILNWGSDPAFLSGLGEIDDLIDKLRGLTPPDEPDDYEIVG